MSNNCYYSPLNNNNSNSIASTQCNLYLNLDTTALRSFILVITLVFRYPLPLVHPICFYMNQKEVIVCIYLL